MRIDFEHLKAEIENARAFLNFGAFGNGVSSEWIGIRERELGIAFPPSYKWWLQNYGGGEINGEEVYSVFEIPLREVVGGDIVAMTDRQKGLEQDKIFVSQPGTDEEFYFRPSEADSEGEMPVYVYDFLNGDASLYAQSFGEFLSKRIAFWSQ